MKHRELKVNCPSCKEIVIWSELSPYRPFCSQRCKLIDFGDWASERNTIAGETIQPPEDNDDSHLS
jgi:endogenous inhibitor of DNA gyrase (YacG/DUF329 family)